MMVQFTDEKNQPKQLSVGVDYAMSKVFFYDRSDPELDYEYLEKQILEDIKPDYVDVPSIPSDFMYRAGQVREGKYNNEIFYKIKD